MTRPADSVVHGNSTRLDFGITGVEVWWVELEDHARRVAGSRDVFVGAIARFLDCDPATIVLHRDGCGKPYLVNQPNVHVNLSRSGPQVVVAIGARPIGVDIEVVRPVPERNALGTLHLTPSEWREVLAADEHRRDELFLLAWTRKEACAKAIGAGLRIAPALIAAGVHRRPTRTTIAFQDCAYVVNVESRFSPANAVVSLAAVLAPEGTPGTAERLPTTRRSAPATHSRSV